MNNLINANLIQNTDGTISGGFVSITGGRYRVVLPGAGLGAVLQKCGGDGGGGGGNVDCSCGPNGNNCAACGIESATVHNTDFCHDASCRPTNGSACQNTAQCGGVAVAGWGRLVSSPGTGK